MLGEKLTSLYPFYNRGGSDIFPRIDTCGCKLFFACPASARIIMAKISEFCFD